MRLALWTIGWHDDDRGGGIATYSRILAQQAADHGHQITVLNATATARDPVVVAPRVRLISVEVRGLSPWGIAERFRDTLRWLVCHGDRPDVVEAPDFAGSAALLDGSVPLVTRLHLPIALLLERNGMARTAAHIEARCLEEMQVTRSAVVTSPSTWMADEATRLWDLATRPLVIPNPADVLPPVHEPKRDRSRRLQLLYFGHLAQHKGVFTLAEALRLWFDRRADARVTFISQESPRRAAAEARMRELLGRHATAQRCRFLPEQHGDELHRTIAAADLVVLPSLYEAFGYTVVEAMAHAKPVISTSGSGVEDIIVHGDNGFLVPPGDAAALATALAEVTADRALMRVVGQRARASLARFSPDRTTARLLATYTQVTEEG